jgi:2-dehydro-3-deoxygalactonokinase
VALDDGVKLDVMRGEECQILGALLQSDKEDGVFILPGTHAKWVQVRAGRIVGFRTYMTGEIFGLLRQSGTLSQLMGGDTADDEAFHKGVIQAQQPDAGNLLHSLFSVRTLGLFDRLPRSALASYMSGLLIGAEIRDAIGWLGPRSATDNITAIGSPALLHAYQLAATSLGVNMVCEDNAEVLPGALLFLAKAAGLSSGH